MKFTMTVLLAALIATPALATDKQTSADLKEQAKVTKEEQKEFEEQMKAIKAFGELKKRDSDKRRAEEKESQSKTVSEKNRADLIMITTTADDSKEDQNEKYRLENLEDPNQKTVSENKKSWSVSPWLGDKRKRLLTPYELQREEEQGKNTTFMGTEVSESYKKAYGVKVKYKFGARAKQ